MDADIGDEEWPYKLRLISLPRAMTSEAENFYVQTMLNIGSLGVDWTFKYDNTYPGFVYCFKNIEHYTLFKISWTIIVTDQCA